MILIYGYKKGDEKSLKLIKEKEIEFVDLRFTDPRGKLQHMTQDLTTIDEDFLNQKGFLS